MEIILRGKSQGKTTDLIVKAAKDFLHIVCHSKREANRLLEQARDMNLDIPFPITIDEFIKGKFYNKEIKGFCIDNVEFLLQKLARGIEVTCITASLKS